VIKYPGEVVALRTGKYVGPVHQRDATVVTKGPRRPPLDEVTGGEGLSTEAFVLH